MDWIDSNPIYVGDVALEESKFECKVSRSASVEVEVDG